MPEASIASRTRKRTPLSWSVQCGMPAYALLAGVRFDRTFRELDAIAEAYEVGRPRAMALLGPDVAYAGPTFSQISYGHINCLGAPLNFVEDGEVGHAPIFDNIQDAIAALSKPVDWATTGMMPFFLDLWKAMRKHYPAENVPFRGFRDQGPITTAWALRGEGFFTDLYDYPQESRTYLDLVTDSIVAFRRFLNEVNGAPPPARVGMTDDMAAMLSPALWPRFVVPVIDRCYRLQNAQQRHAHIENLLPDHLQYLDDLKMDGFDPSVSPRLTAADLRDRCQAQFAWRLNAMQMRDWSPSQVRDYLITGVRDGASSMFCVVEGVTVTEHCVGNIRTFIEVAKELAPSKARR